MSVESSVTKADGWHLGETKSLVFTCDVTLTGLSLTWYLKTEAGGAILLTKTTPTITINGAVAAVPIVEADYVTLLAGPYYHELWDATGNLVLAYGDAFLMEGDSTPP